jgi:hypothetical protein
MYDVKFQCPFTLILSGSSQSGKTNWVFNFLRFKNDLISKKPPKTFLFYKKYQEIYNAMLKQKLVDEIFEIDEKMIEENEFVKIVSKYKNKGGALCIFDDCMEYVDENSSKIFTKIAHHENCNVIFITQSLFVDNKHFRMMSKNSNYITIMKNPRDISHIKHLASQMGMDTKLLLSAYKEATKTSYSYLLIDFYPTTPEHIRLRSNIFVTDGPMKTYMHKNSI